MIANTQCNAAQMATAAPASTANTAAPPAVDTVAMLQRIIEQLGALIDALSAAKGGAAQITPQAPASPAQSNPALPKQTDSPKPTQQHAAGGGHAHGDHQLITATSAGLPAQKNAQGVWVLPTTNEATPGSKIPKNALQNSGAAETIVTTLGEGQGYPGGAEAFWRVVSQSIQKYADPAVARAEGYSVDATGNSNGIIHAGKTANKNDGVIDPTKPDALIYMRSTNGKMTLVGAMFRPEGVGMPPKIGDGAEWHAHYGPEDLFMIHAWLNASTVDQMYSHRPPKDVLALR